MRGVFLIKPLLHWFTT